jgi:hypothetical protein
VRNGLNKRHRRGRKPRRPCLKDRPSSNSPSATMVAGLRAPRKGSAIDTVPTQMQCQCRNPGEEEAVP